MDGLSLDQIQVLLAVVDQGSFSAAARHLDRAQSAVTYAVQKLEDQIGAALFDRSAYRPVLTEAGRSLLPRARRIAGEVDAFQAQASGLSAGIEPELSLVVNSMFPMCALLTMLKAFGEKFPQVPIRVHVESLGAAALLVIDRTCRIGLLCGMVAPDACLTHMPLDPVELIPVAAPHHPLAGIAGAVPTETLTDHVQLVLTDRSQQPGSPDHGVLSGRTWRLADLGAKHAMLLAGIGWGSLPEHMIRDDLAAGRLRRIHPLDWGEGRVVMRMWAAWRRDVGLGIAARWMVDHLQARASSAP